MLAEAILKTLKYFDVQEHPLTLLEIHAYLLNGNFDQRQETSLVEIENILKSGLSAKVQNCFGFYFLPGREILSERRLQNNFYAVERLKRVRRILPRTRFIPFVDAVALTGSEALSNSKKGSDIDLLVFTKPNRIWLARITTAIFFQISGMRRHNQYIENRFCLNHFIASGKEIDADQNLYTAMEYLNLIPFFGGEAVYNFQIQNLPWISKYLQQPKFFKYHTKQPAAIKKTIEKIFSGRLGDFLEELAGRFQLNKIIAQEHIIIAKDELSFHPGSKGQQVLSKFLK